jgi:hypothetical protein
MMDVKPKAMRLKSRVHVITAAYTPQRPHPGLIRKGYTWLHLDLLSDDRKRLEM